MQLSETLNRTLKLAMDEGRARSYEEAQALFASFRLRIVVRPGFSRIPGVQAAVLTLLVAAPKTFLGGVEVSGALDERCTMAWFAGLTLEEVAVTAGAVVTAADSGSTPTVTVGEGDPLGDGFAVCMSLGNTGFTVGPDVVGVSEAATPVEVGVAAAGAALNEAFQHAYRKVPLAGQRRIRFRLPAGSFQEMPRRCWVVGLGHLGQAVLWTLALAGSGRGTTFKLTDYDHVSRSSLSTCLLVSAHDVGHKKVDTVGRRLSALGYAVERDGVRLDLAASAVAALDTLAIVAVDNVGLRRSLDRLKAARVLEAGIGDGADAFTRVQLHAFPGPRLARDVWSGEDPRASRRVDLSQPAYQALLKESGDECGTTLVAGRSVATPFVGAFCGALLAWCASRPSQSEYAWNFDVNSL